jgi:hypothetical protein
MRENCGQAMKRLEAEGAWFPMRHPEAACRQWSVWDKAYMHQKWRIAPKDTKVKDVLRVHPEDRLSLLRAIKREDLWSHVSQHGHAEYVKLPD